VISFALPCFSESDRGVALFTGIEPISELRLLESGGLVT
jgi:hypothetical protein